MDTRNILDTRRHARGGIKPVVIAILAVFALLAVGAWLLIIKPHQELVSADAGGHLSTPVPTATRAAPPPANVAGMDINQLLGEARNAMNEQRYLAPAGNNAFEFYLRVLEKDPGNKVASDALRETFPFAAPSAEQAINARDFSEAQRQIALLAKADPTNFTLTILRSKLDAQRKTLDQQQQLALEQQKAREVAAQKSAADRLAAAQLAEQQKVQLAEQQKAEAARASQRQTQTQTQQSIAAATPEPGGSPTADTASGTEAAGKTSSSVLMKAVGARYPSAAMRARQAGWVVVAFTVDADGSTSDVKVVDANPRHVFDRAAIDAVARYEFKPAMKNGVAVTSIKQQRIEFKL